MGKFIVVLGDFTTHGGKVLYASSSLEISGKPAALFNDLTTCPLHGVNSIIQCDASIYEENGRGIVLHGSMTQCGATVIASVQDMEVS